MGHYTHLTLEEREDIMCMRREGISVRSIARALGRAASTVSREVRRNFCGFYYRASTAQARYEGRRRSCRRPRLMEDPERRMLVKELALEGRWSPEQLAGRISLERPELAVSATTIYRAVWSGALDREIGGRKAGARLRRKGRRRRGAGAEARGKIKVSHELCERPREAAERSRLGDWEGDTVSGRAGGPCLVTMVDRRSGYLAGGKASSKRSCDVLDAALGAMRGHVLETITLDRGKEFAGHARLTAELGVECYFCPPHQPWERGTNENTNGLLREYFPKGTPFEDVSEEQVQEAFAKLNLRPRKRLGWRCPFEVYHSTVLHLL